MQEDANRLARNVIRVVGESKWLFVYETVYSNLIFLVMWSSDYWLPGDISWSDLGLVRQRFALFLIKTKR